MLTIWLKPLQGLLAQLVARMLRMADCMRSWVQLPQSPSILSAKLPFLRAEGGKSQNVATSQLCSCQRVVCRAEIVAEAAFEPIH